MSGQLLDWLPWNLAFSGVGVGRVLYTWICCVQKYPANTIKFIQRILSLGQQRNRNIIHRCNVCFNRSLQRINKNAKAQRTDNGTITLLDRPDQGCIPWQLWTCSQPQMLVLRKTYQDSVLDKSRKHGQRINAHIYTYPVWLCETNKMKRETSLLFIFWTFYTETCHCENVTVLMLAISWKHRCA